MSGRRRAKKRKKGSSGSRKRTQERKGEGAAADVLRDTARSMEDMRRQREQRAQDIIVIDDSSDSDGPGPSSLPGYRPVPDPDSPPFVPSNPRQPSMPSPVGSAPRGVLILGERVGAGAFGQVVNSVYYDPNAPKSKIINYVGQPLQPRKHYAVKIQDKDETKHEMNILRKLGESPYIMKVYGRGDVPGETKMDAMVSDMYTQTLGNRIKKEAIETRRRNFPVLVRQMFEAVALLASKNIMHRDLHLGNIMFGSNPFGDPKIIDFGWSIDTRGRAIVPFPMPDTEPYRTFHPPEQRMLLGGVYRYGKCTTKFDVYSMATNLIELVYDSEQNQGVSLPGDFDLLMICAICNIPVQIAGLAQYGKYKDMDKADVEFRAQGRRLYPDARRMSACVVERNQSTRISSHFVEHDGYIKLRLDMPPQISAVLKACLQVEIRRPTAAQAVRLLQSPSLSSEVASSSAFLKLRF
jgi:serine/threonine protein kinase